MARTPVTRPAPVEHPVLDVVAGRWSPRALDPDRDVDRPTLLRLLEAARWAPSSGNAQPWRVVVLDATVPEQRDAVRDCLKPGNAWARRAPVLLAALVATTWPGSDDPNRTAWYDAGAAMHALSLQAVHEGLIAHQMGGVDHARLRGVLGLPEQVGSAAVIAVGYPGDDEVLDERGRQRQRRPRIRAPLAERVTLGRWGGPPVG